MIFKHLFRSKHQSPDPNVRIQAIENFNKEDVQQKSILHELAFNDADANVSLAALTKLDSFPLWYKMSEIAKNERIQKRSQRVIEEALLNDQNQYLSKQDKRSFILECKDNRLLEKLVTLDWVQADNDLVATILKRLDKPQLNEKIMLSSHSEGLVLGMLNALPDNPQSRKLLLKLSKKSAFEAVVQASEQQLEIWRQAEQLPSQIESQVKMVLSRLLALKDSDDFQRLTERKTELDQQYAVLAKQFECLAEGTRVSYQQKYADIDHKLQKVLATLKPIWQAAQTELKIQQDTSTIIQDNQQLLQQIHEGLQGNITQVSGQQVETWLNAIELSIATVSEFTHALPSQFTQQHSQLETQQQHLLGTKNTLENLPQVYVAIEKAKALIQQLSDLPLPEEQSQADAAHEFINELSQQWKNQVAPHQSYLPAESPKQWQQHKRAWQEAIHAIRRQVKQDVSRCKNKMRAVESLIQQGKFKSAMGLYEKVNTWFTALPEQQQTQLAKSFADIQKQVANLQDWQEYIAAPRKPALLKEAEELVANPLPVAEQAKAIKGLRAQWTSLGKLDTEADTALNQAFDQTLERAFVPCREAYQQEEAKRQHNLVLKQELLAELTALNLEQQDVNQLIKPFRALQQRWGQVGEVDYKIKASLNKEYQALVQPIKRKVNQFYQDNQALKQGLIAKATKLDTLDDIDQAIEQVKALQQQWKQIGHGGQKEENRLWDEFRQANDAIFAKRKAASNEYKKELNQQVADLKQRLTQLHHGVEQAQSASQLQQSLGEQAEIESLLTNLPSAQKRSLDNQLRTTISLQQDKLQQQQTLDKNKTFICLFSYLKTAQLDAEDQAEELKQQLPKAWQQWLNQEPTKADRHKLTVQLEILSEHASPDTDGDLRKQLQLEMMAQKLAQGEQNTQLDLLQAWVTAGPLSSADLQLLLRIEPLFVPIRQDS
jgi:hypothetical protein